MKPLPLLFLTLFNSILGLSVLFPINGPLARDLGFTEFQTGFFATGYAVMQFLLAPFWGGRSEVAGRKPVMLLGILGFAVGFYLFGAFAWLGYQGVITGMPLFLLMLGARLLGGAFSSATLPTAQAYLADITPREKRTQNFALLGAAFGLGIIFGPAIGAALSGFGLLVPVFFSATVGLLNALFVWFVLPESLKAEDRPALPPKLSWLDGRIWPILAIGLITNLAWIGMEQTVSFLYQDRLNQQGAQAARSVGIALVLVGVISVVIQGFVVRTIKLPPRSWLSLGLPISLLGFVGLAISTTFPLLTLSMLLVAGGGALSNPGITAAQSLAVSDAEQGAIAGLASSAQALGRMLGPLLATGLYGVRIEYPYILSGLLIAVALVFVVVRPDLGKQAEGRAQG